MATPIDDNAADEQSDKSMCQEFIIRCTIIAIALKTLFERTSGEIALDVENLPCANGCSEVPILTLPLGSVPLTRKVMHIRPPLQTGIVKKIVQKKLAANGQLFYMFL